MACRLFFTKPSPASMLINPNLTPCKHNTMIFELNTSVDVFDYVVPFAEAPMR